MLARVLSAAVNGIEAFPIEAEVNSGRGDTVVVIVGNSTPKPICGARIRLTSWNDVGE